MKKLEVLQELPKCDIEIWSEQTIGKMALIDFLDTECLYTFTLYKMQFYTKLNKVKDKTRYACNIC